MGLSERDSALRGRLVRRGAHRGMEIAHENQGCIPSFLRFWQELPETVDIDILGVR